ncbi:hypothetical protein ACOSP7_014272 [Xanthoceras sorbifolium]
MGAESQCWKQWQPSATTGSSGGRWKRWDQKDLQLAAAKMATVRNLKIKMSTCKRLVKELDSYEKEVEREAAKTVDMKDKGADPYDLKQQENVLAESRMMIPDCRKRLEAAMADLKGTLVELEEVNQEGPEIEDARSTITEVEKLFQTTED